MEVLNSESCRIQKSKYEKHLKKLPWMYEALRIADCDQEDSLAITCSYVLAPVLFGFTRWLLAEACKHQQKRLYFLARDGYFPYHAAQILCKKFELTVECRYLCCSRFSLRQPLYHLNHSEAVDYLCRKSIGVTAKKVLQRAGLTASERESVMKALQLPFGQNAAITDAQLTILKEELLLCPSFMEWMDAHSKKAWDLLTGYLYQEGLMEETADALVDSGWMGSMQKSLTDTLSLMGRKRKLEGYYWGLYGLPCSVDRNSYHCYDFTPEGEIAEKALFNNCVFEAVYTAPHGMTIGYRKEENQYFPSFGEISEYNKFLASEINRFLFKDFQNLTGACSSPRLTEEELRQERHVLRELLCQFMRHPSTKEVELFGRVRFSDDVLAGETLQLAAPLSKQGIAAGHALPHLLSELGIRPKPLQQSAWYEGSLIRYGKHVNWHLWQYTLWQMLRQLYQKGKG